MPPGTWYEPSNLGRRSLLKRRRDVVTPGEALCITRAELPNLNLSVDRDVTNDPEDLCTYAPRIMKPVRCHPVEDKAVALRQPRPCTSDVQDDLALKN